MALGPELVVNIRRPAAPGAGVLTCAVVMLSALTGRTLLPQQLAAAHTIGMHTQVVVLSFFSASRTGMWDLDPDVHT